MKNDPIVALRALRPTYGADDLWDPQVQGAVRDRIQAHAVAPVHRQLSRRRRAAVTAAITVILASAGVTAASASGVVSQAFTEAFAYWSSTPVPGYQGIDPSTAVRVAGTTGPDGILFNVYVAYGEDGYHCIGGAFENPATEDSSSNLGFSDPGSECRVGVNTMDFGSTGTSITFDPTVYSYQVSAGSAVRATVRTAAGPAVPPVLVEGTFYGWFQTPAGSEPWPKPWPTLTGYDRDGSVVGEAEL